MGNKTKRETKPTEPLDEGDPNDLIPVNTRFFRSDISALKEMARREGLKWQVMLRVHVHRTLKPKVLP